MSESNNSPQTVSKVVSVGTTATLLVGKNPSAGRTLLVRNFGAATIYVGAKGVTTTDGFPIDAGGTLMFEAGSALYGIVASSTVNARVLEVLP
jgi:hypothetical protein